MAAVDRRIPNLDDFVGLNWSCWVDRVDIEPPDAQSEDTKYGRDRSETMTLRKEDMAIYGYCPAQDDFYLVVCSHCGKLVKPQAFEEHCEQRHCSLTKTCGQSKTALQQQPRASRLPSNVLRDRQRDSRCKETSVPSSASSQRRPSKPQKEAVSLPTVEKVPLDKSHFSSTLRPRSELLHSGPTASSSSSSSSFSSSFSLGPSSTKPVQKPSFGHTSNSPQRETRTYSRLHKNINKKEWELNKKFEGSDQDKKKVLSQEPIQTMDSTRQQKVKEVITDSDQLTATISLAQDPEQLVIESLGAFNENPSRCSKLTFNANSHIVRSRDAPETFPEEDSSVELEVQPPYPFNQSLPSSDDSDNDEGHTDLSSTSWHPKPLGLCTFGCRTFGCSIFTFDRRLHHLRIAASAMFEDHMNSHLWKKMPQPASNLRSSHATPSTRGSPVRTGARPNPPGSHSINSTSLEKIKNTQNNSKRTKSLSSLSSVSTIPGQQCTSAGQPGKVRLEQRSLVQNTKTGQKTTQLSHCTSSKHIPPSHVPITGSLSKKTPPLSPLRPSERNTPVLNESLQPKPCSLHSKRRPPGIAQPKVGSCDDRTLMQKRKSQSPAPSSPSKKCPRLSPPSRSSLFSWKRDSTQDVWLGVWRKEQTSEDDTQGQSY